MSAIFELPDGDLTLNAEQLSSITGARTSSGQLDWLRTNAWKFHTTRAGAPVVGRLYANLKLAGIEASSVVKPEAWTPDFAALNS